MKNLENIFTLPLIRPRDYQLDAWRAYANGCKNILISLPRRNGKDLTSLSILVDYALKHPGSNCVLLAPLLTQAVKIWWAKGQSIEAMDMVTGFPRDYKGSMLDVTIPRAIVAKVNSSTYTVTLRNGSVISLQGSRDLKASAGQKISAVLISEAAQHDQSLFPIISPILEESGGLTIVNSTVTGPEDFFFKMVRNSYGLDSWHCTYLTALETKNVYWVSPIKADGTRNYCINPELHGKVNPWTGNLYTNLQDKLDLGENESLLIREYLNIPTNIETGSYYASILNDLRTSCSIDPDHTVDPSKPVFASLDLGVSDSTAIVIFQVTDTPSDELDLLHIIDSYENTGQDIAHYLNVIKNKSYSVAATFVPHDSNNRNLQTGINLIEYCRTKLGYVLTPISRSMSVTTDIQTCKAYLAKATINGACTGLLGALSAYREHPSTGKPVHDDSSNYADSVRYAIIAVDRKMITPAMLTSWNGFSGKNYDNPRIWVENTRTPLDESGYYPANVEAIEVLGGQSFYMPERI